LARERPAIGGAAGGLPSAGAWDRIGPQPKTTRGGYWRGGIPPGASKRKPVRIRHGRATVTGERSREMPLGPRVLGRLGGAEIRESGDLPRE
jgi:hypothetical protein